MSEKKLSPAEVYKKALSDLCESINPCPLCSVYTGRNGGYETDYRDDHGNWVEGRCEHCAWFYGSNYEA
jgi:hypothetical protein